MKYMDKITKYCETEQKAVKKELNTQKYNSFDHKTKFIGTENTT